MLHFFFQEKGSRIECQYIVVTLPGSDHQAQKKVAPWPSCEAFNLPNSPNGAMMTKGSEY